MADQEARNKFDAAVEAIRQNPDDFDSWDVAELLADELALTLSGETRPVQILKKMLYRHMREVEAAYVNAPPAEKVTALRNMANRVPERELERWWCKILNLWG